MAVDNDESTAGSTRRTANHALLLQQKHIGTLFCRADRSTHSGNAASSHHHVYFKRDFLHCFVFPALLRFQCFDIAASLRNTVCHGSQNRFAGMGCTGYSVNIKRLLGDNRFRYPGNRRIANPRGLSVLTNNNGENLVFRELHSHRNRTIIALCRGSVASCRVQDTVRRRLFRRFRSSDSTVAHHTRHQQDAYASTEQTLYPCFSHPKILLHHHKHTTVSPVFSSSM